ALGTFEGYVAYVDGTDGRLVLNIKPLHVGPVLASGVWASHSAVLTSATVPMSLPDRIGLDAQATTQLSVSSPFDYERNSLLYCSPDFPDRNSSEFREFVHDELEALISAAGGRTLALFTSNQALNAAATELRSRLDFPILTPSDHSRQRLIEMFLADERACIFASSGFFQGVDVPGDALRLVILDKVPFPMRTDPLLEARRDLLGQSAFMQIDVPIAAATLAQAAGRLIRSATDHGVVAILDSRLVKRRYKGAVLEGVAHFPETSQLDDVKSFFHRR
ncbi:MAG: ATP-dependent DNA helicase, partial [Acidimicrobiia bacterium]|nr:ATP-dependent DNA helicase [Acidimicrobiia bacterium]